MTLNSNLNIKSNTFWSAIQHPQMYRDIYMFIRMIQNYFKI
jgi:hypothetical protein